MTEKLEALEAWLLAILQAHDSSFRLATHMAAGTLDGVATADRDATMGDPVRYCEVFWTGEDESGPGMARNAGAQSLFVPDVFEVIVYYGFEPGAEYDGSTQQGFYALCKASASADAPGLLPSIRRTKSLTTDAGELVLMGDPVGVSAVLAGAGEIHHQLSFTVTLT